MFLRWNAEQSAFHKHDVFSEADGLRGIAHLHASSLALMSIDVKIECLSMQDL